MIVRPLAALLMLLTVFSSTLTAQKAPVAFKVGHLHTAAGPVIENGVLVIQNGKITAVGKEGEVEIPAGATLLAVPVVIPGLVDSHSHLGVASRPHVPSNIDGNEKTGPVQSVVRAIDSINARDPGIRMAQAGGVTTANIMPGSGNVIGGQTVYVKLRGSSVEEMRIKADGVLGGLKMANGENPKRYGKQDKAPMTRMKVAALQRAEFMKARDYMRKWLVYQKRAVKDDVPPPDIDLALEPLVEVLQGKRTVHFHTHRADDILTVLRLKREFGFELVIQHGTEGYKVVNQIAAAKVPVSMTIVDSPGGKAEVVDFIEACGRELTAAGVPIHVNTDDPITESRFFLRTAAATLRGGLDQATALKAITLHPAQAMHLAHRVGSLQVGKDADLAVLSGEPFSVYTRVLETWIDGKRVFRLGDEKQRLYQTGGFALDDGSLAPAQKELVKKPATVKAPAMPPGSKPVASGDTQFVILAGRVHTVSGKPIINGAVFVRDGKVVWVGPRADLELNEKVPVLVAAEVTPGLIDTHSIVPLAGEYNITADQDADEKTDPNQADARVLDGFNPSEPLLRLLLEHGVTVIHATPGHANVIGGSSGIFRTHGKNVGDMTIRFPHAVLFNLGAGPKKTYKEKAPGTRMGTAAIIRQALQSAANYERKKAIAIKKNDPAEPGPDFDPKDEALRPVVQGKVQAMFTAHRADDLQTALRLSREFTLKPVLALATEGYLIRDQLREAKVPVIVHPTMQRVGGIETINSFLGNAASLSDSGVPISICSGVEGYVPKSRVIRWEAAIGMTYGLGFDRALKSITLDAARTLGIEEQYGSIENGKVADLVLFSGDPFEHATHVTHVIVNGRLVHIRSEKKRLLLARDRNFINCPEPGCCAAF